MRLKEKGIVDYDSEERRNVVFIDKYKCIKGKESGN
jgi:hypothetical protein